MFIYIKVVILAEVLKGMNKKRMAAIFLGTILISMAVGSALTLFLFLPPQYRGLELDAAAGYERCITQKRILDLRFMECQNAVAGLNG